MSLPYQPYFYIATKKDAEREVSSYLSKKLSGRLAGIDMVDKEDLDKVSQMWAARTSLHLSLRVLQPNHLVGIKGRYLKLRFHSVDELMKAKR